VFGGRARSGGRNAGGRITAQRRAKAANLRPDQPSLVHRGILWLIERRDKIGRAYFSTVLPLENFHV
jgi:hypothetical protein